MTEPLQHSNGPIWHSRGYLPHFDDQEKVQHISIHLADSLPGEEMAQLERDIRILPQAKQDIERRKRLEAWIDAGHGCCLFRKPNLATMAQHALQHFDAERYRLLAWAIMPNHAHILFQPMNGWTTAKIVASWKKWTASKIIKWHKDTIPQTTCIPTPVWHREYWDRFIRDGQHFKNVVRYIHNNPVKAGLVKRAEDWPWSSAQMCQSGDWRSQG